VCDEAPWFKWIHETETRNRLKGDIVWLKVIYKF